MHICPHCQTENFGFDAFDRPMAGGQAYAQLCHNCNKVIGIRPRLMTDPPPTLDLEPEEMERLLFHQWRLTHITHEHLSKRICTGNCIV